MQPNPNRLHILCRNYQVCLPETAGQIIEVCKDKGVELPEKPAFIAIFFEAVGMINTDTGEKIFFKELSSANSLSFKSYHSIKENPLHYTFSVEYKDADPVFNFSELNDLLEKLGFDESDLEWTSYDGRTQVRHYGWGNHQSPLPRWYAEALAQFILANINKAPKLNPRTP